MELSEALPFLQENHLAVVTTIGPSGRPQSTVVSAALYEGKLAFVSRQRTSKVKNTRRSGRGHPQPPRSTYLCPYSTVNATVMPRP